MLTDWAQNRLLMGASLALALLMGRTALAESLPSAKATARVGNVNIIDAQQQNWSTMMRTSIKTANAKDLLMNVSLECGLYTQTEVKSKGGQKDTSSAEAMVQVRILVDGRPAMPGHVTFCSRYQELSAKLSGILDNCEDANGDGIISIDECELIDEEINLILRTMNANAFNFILDNLSSGVHEIEVQAKINTASSAQQGSASGLASIGNGSVTVEEVRMFRGDAVDF